ncbi:MAG: hypothetical protein JEZ07_06380 [Phycisphaerae bacterium]|nr:hypothetical protein [Phycisphaerae bacterium]
MAKRKAKKDVAKVESVPEVQADANVVTIDADRLLQIEAEADACQRIQRLNESVTAAYNEMEARKNSHKEAKGVYENAVSELNKFIRQCGEKLPLFELREYQRPIDAMKELTAEQMRIICWRYQNPTDDDNYEISKLPEQFQELKRSQILKALEERKEFILDELCYPQNEDDKYLIGFFRKEQTFADAEVVCDDGSYDYEALCKLIANYIPADFYDVLGYLRDDYSFKIGEVEYVDASIVRANCWDHPDKFNLVHVEAYGSGHLKEFEMYFDVEDGQVKTLAGDIVEVLGETEE